MKKRQISLICLLLACLCAFTVTVEAVTHLDTQKKCSMTLHYVQDGVGFSGLDISVYRVAKANPDGSFDLTYPYNAWPIDIHGITSQDEWKVVASTLKSFVVKDSVAATKTGETNPAGTVVFNDLETGLYLVMGTTAENKNGIYEFNTFMIYVPTPGTDGSYDYDVEAVPKCIKRTEKTEYKVVKFWKDAGYTSSRPKEVTVEIFKDGVLQETVRLNSANRWTYTWHVTKDQDGAWTVTEKNVPTNYTVSIAENNGIFSVTNSRKTATSSPPKTGDMYPLWPAVITMCISGSLLVVLGIYHMRKKK